MKKTFISSLLFVASALFYVGCSSSSAPTVLLPGKTMQPGVGSTFTYENTPIDTNGVVQTSKSYETRDSIAEIGVSHAGKTNVTHIISTDTSGGTMNMTDAYINYEADGDISIYVGPTASGGATGLPIPGSNLTWMTFPAQSRTALRSVIADTTITLTTTTFPIPIQITLLVVDSEMYVNYGTTSVQGKEIAIINLKQSFTITATVLGQNMVFRSLQSISFAPSIGYLSYQRLDPIKIGVFGYPSQAGSETVLTSYNFK